MASSPPSLVAVPTLYAGLGRRIAAQLIDGLIAITFVFATGFFMRGLRAAGLWRPMEGLNPIVTWREMAVPGKIAILVAFLVSMGLFYWAFFEASEWQASIGKRWLNIYVTDRGNQRLSLARSLGRAVAKCVLNSFYLAAVSIATIAASPRKQALHDFVAGTLVVRGRPPGGGSLEPWRILAGFGMQFLWLVATFFAVIPRVQ